MAEDIISGIDKFKANFNQGARANRFDCRVFCPRIGLAEQSMGLRVQSTSLPGRTLETDTFNYGGGPERQLPNNVSHGDSLTMSFYCDQTFLDRYLLEAWLDLIWKPQEGGGDTANPYLNPLFTYPIKSAVADAKTDGYYGTIEIDQIRMDDKPALSYKFQEAYPISYADMTLDQATGDSIMTFDIDFAYSWFEVENVSDKNPMDADFEPTEPMEGQGPDINKGRRGLDIALDILKVTSRFGKGSKLLQKLTNLDTGLTRLSSMFPRHDHGHGGD